MIYVDTKAQAVFYCVCQVVIVLSSSMAWLARPVAIHIIPFFFAESYVKGIWSSNTGKLEYNTAVNYIVLGTLQFLPILR